MKASKKLLLSLGLGIGMTLIACSSGGGSDADSGKKPAKQTKVQAKTDVKDGERLLKQTCYVCHSPTASEKGMLAPPMAAVKNVYLKDKGMSEKEFITALTSFVQKPSKEKALMTEYVERYGLMQGLPYPDEQLEKIAKAIYQTDIPAPDWYKE